MPGTSNPYPVECCEQILSLVGAGLTPQEPAKEFEPTVETIRNWVKQAEFDAGERQDGPTTEEKQELARLRKEVRQLRQERDILAKAAI